MPEGLPLLANPHMHLLEAVQSWALIDADPGWQSMADEIVGLALERLIDPELGVVFERFDGQWRALSEDSDRLLEPGHQFEWAWLLLRARGRSRTGSPERCGAAPGKFRRDPWHPRRRGGVLVAP